MWRLCLEFIISYYYVQVWYSNPYLKDWLEKHAAASQLDKLKWAYYLINKTPWYVFCRCHSFWTSVLFCFCMLQVQCWRRAWLKLLLSVLCTVLNLNLFDFFTMMKSSQLFCFLKLCLWICFPPVNTFHFQQVLPWWKWGIFNYCRFGNKVASWSH